MRVGIHLQINVDPEKWAEHNNGPWPQDDRNAFNTAVRQDIKGTVRHQLSMADIFEMCKVEIEVK